MAPRPARACEASARPRDPWRRKMRRTRRKKATRPTPCEGVNTKGVEVMLPWGVYTHWRLLLESNLCIRAAPGATRTDAVTRTNTKREPVNNRALLFGTFGTRQRYTQPHFHSTPLPCARSRSKRLELGSNSTELGRGGVRVRKQGGGGRRRDRPLARRPCRPCLACPLLP